MRKYMDGFILGLNTTINMDYIKKYLNLKLFRIKFSMKNSEHAYFYLAQEWS